MAKRWLKGKTHILITTILALMSVVVAGVTTYAWFQLERMPVETDLISGSPDINIDSVTGYKVEHTTGAYGEDVFTPSNIVSRKSNGTGLTIESTDNDDLEGDNVNYDIPDLGIGYYIIWPNANGLLKYTRTYDANGNVTGRNYTKFQKMQYGSKYYVTLSNIEADTELKIKKYTFENSTTINKQVKVSDAWPDHEIEEQNNGDVLIKIDGTYTIWMDTNGFSESNTTPKTYSVDKVYAQQTTSSNEKTLLPKGLTKKNVGAPSAGSGNKVVYCTNGVGWNNVYLHYWGGASDSTWPGGKMTLLYINEDGKGVYYLEVPSGTTGVIPNNGSGAQTADISLGGNNAVYVNNTSGNHGTWNLNFETYYFYNYYEGNKIFNAPKAVTETHTNGSGWVETYNLGDQSKYAPFSLTDEGNGFWSFSVPENAMRRVYFGDSNAQSNWVGTKTIYCRKNNAPTQDNRGKCWYPNSYDPNDSEEEYDGFWDNNGGASTYYLYDPNYWFGEGTPFAYCWKNSDNTKKQKPWPGNVMITDQNAFSSDGPDVKGRIFKITAPNIYDRIIFGHCDNTDSVTVKKTIDLTATDQNGKAFVLTKEGQNEYILGEWSEGLDCFYLDTSSGIDWATVQMLNDSGSKVIYATLANFEISTNFYKVYYSKTNYAWARFRNANEQSTQWGNSGAYPMSNRTSNYLYIGTSIVWDGYSNVRETLCAQPNANGANIGTATIKISTDGGTTWKDPLTNSTSVFTTTMSNGDVTKDNFNFSNYFIYEMGLELAYGTKVKVEVDDSDADDYDDYFESRIVKTYQGTSTCASVYGGSGPNSGSTVQYLDVQENSITIKKPEGAVGTSARFNFYIYNDKGAGQNNKGVLSIAMVPKKGNGYYIMDYGSISGNTTEGFVDPVKMSSTSNNHATYNGFYASDGDKIFVRKYIDTLDELCPTITINGASAHQVTTGGITADMGVIEFDSDDYYLIEVNGTSVTISTYTHDSFFQLGPLDAYDNSVSTQYTSLVLDVTFSVDTVNSFDLTLALEVSIPESLRPYVGVQFYYNEATGTGGTNPYTYMRTNYLATLKNYANLNSLPTYTITATQSEETELHAYIIIDYVSGSLGSLPAYITDTLSFKLVTSYSNS